MYLSPVRNNRADSVILFIPHAGSCGEAYMPWFRYFSQHADCRYLQLPARGARREDVMPDSIQSMADLIMPELENLMDKKIVFFGHSMGGLIAFELACKMESYWDKPAHALFISGCRAPDEPIIRSLTGLGDKQLIRELAGMGGTETFLLEQPELLYPFLATLRQDICLCEKYVSPISEPLRTPIHILWGTEDDLITQKMIDGWRRFSSGENIAFYPHKGDHFYHHQQSENVMRLICEVLTPVGNN
ncbi:alpha/beta fold hydrolase [Pectobacterium parvum]|uniref:Alpha/beta fold hydrolase n=1 Tax=Pectobacterium parvum TaxID=2778550 RepID=A0AAP9IDH6_9GAMM|nr:MULTISPECIES: alpha/beta fold hydrolase [Pectobacterium]QHQ22982.1 alpha/beta fold hydrolase [Pectobacterium parvum]UFK38658.1 alpha/beta fold hydrolase [Pectobacterium parvum]GKW41832.1 thioesterase [Pectobacterium carotovorum subsp. carotovorum]